jgi:putative oxidoreductase
MVADASWGLLILRIALGVTFLPHGRMKLNPSGPMKGPGGFAAWLKQMGVPMSGLLAWVVVLLETIGAGLLILGLGTRVVALGLAIDMLVAILLVKRGMQKVGFMDAKGGWEFEFLLLAQAVALVLTGAGSIALDPVVGL